MKLNKNRKKHHNHDEKDAKNKKENINPLKSDSKAETRPIAIANVNLTKWSKLFDDDVGFGISPSDSSPLRKKANKLVESIPNIALNPECPNTKTDFIGSPITLATATALRQVLFGKPDTLFTNDWKKCFFKFRDAKASIPYGLDATLPGPRPVVMAVQAHVVKHLLFSKEFCPDEEIKNTFRKPPTPDAGDQEFALIDAIVDVIWTAAVEMKSSDAYDRNAVVVIPGDDDCFKSDGHFNIDGFTEKYTQRVFPACILLAYSVLLSRTTANVIKDMGGWQSSLLTESSRSTQAFVNLLLTGRASCFLHNNTLLCNAKGVQFKSPKPGLQRRSEIGFLFYSKAENDKNRTMVDSMYKTPKVPIWVTMVNGSFAVLFCTSLSLIADWRTELYFTLHYYTGHYSQADNTAITLDTRTRVAPITSDISMWDDEEEKELKQPSLELCIGTKWPECLMDWNGETPYY